MSVYQTGQSRGHVIVLYKRQNIQHGKDECRCRSLTESMNFVSVVVR